jgi:hypothetical protein
MSNMWETYRLSPASEPVVTGLEGRFGSPGGALIKDPRLLIPKASSRYLGGICLWIDVLSLVPGGGRDEGKVGGDSDERMDGRVTPECEVEVDLLGMGKDSKGVDVCDRPSEAVSGSRETGRSWEGLTPGVVAKSRGSELSRLAAGLCAISVVLPGSGADIGIFTNGRLPY